MPPRVLRPSRLKLLFLLLISSAFVAIGLKMVSDGLTTGWLCALFFGLCALVFVVQLLPNASYLQLNQNGFTVCALFRSYTLNWTDVSAFEVAWVGVDRMKSNRMIVFNFSNNYRHHATARRLAISIAGYEGALPDTYGLSHQNLADLLNEYRNECLRNHLEDI